MLPFQWKNFARRRKIEVLFFFFGWLIPPGESKKTTPTQHYRSGSIIDRQARYETRSTDRRWQDCRITKLYPLTRISTTFIPIPLAVFRGQKTYFQYLRAQQTKTRFRLKKRCKLNVRVLASHFQLTITKLTIITKATGNCHPARHRFLRDLDVRTSVLTKLETD